MKNWKNSMGYHSNHPLENLNIKLLLMKKNAKNVKKKENTRNEIISKYYQIKIYLLFVSFFSTDFINLLLLHLLFLIFFGSKN